VLLIISREELPESTHEAVRLYEQRRVMVHGKDGSVVEKKAGRCPNNK
jgi:hypothetical protein